MYYYLNNNLLWALLCLSTLIVSLGLNAVGAPGNWVMLVIATLYSIILEDLNDYFKNKIANVKHS